MPEPALRPDLVVIEMTPFAAREPYNDAAAAPSTISTLSISAGLMSASVPPWSASAVPTWLTPTPLLRITPSTI